MKKIVIALLTGAMLLSGAATAEAAPTKTPVAKGHPQWQKNRVITVSINAPRGHLTRAALVEFTRASQTKFKVVTSGADLKLTVRDLPGNELGRGSFKADRHNHIFAGSVVLDYDVARLPTVAAKSVINHQLGHAFGLLDTRNGTSVMAPVPNRNLHLSFSDKVALRPVGFRVS